MSINDHGCDSRSRLYAALSVVLVTAMAVASIFIYFKTKSSYRQVGFNDGVVSANVDAIRLIRSHGGVREDCSKNLHHHPIEFMRAKSDALYMWVEDGGVVFCEYK